MKPRSLLLLFALSAFGSRLVTGVHAQSNVSTTNRHAYGANTGWIDARAGDGTFGVKAGPCVLKGFLYSANCGWINVGRGDPQNGQQYSNASGNDFGVNRLPDGRLRGLAWGAAIGWINFEETGNPRIDAVSGAVTGRAWSAGTGWISFDTPETDLQFLSPDADGDTIPDVWELLHAANLTVLGANKDTDGDGQNDAAEYVAGTSPVDRTDHLRIVSLNFQPGADLGSLRWTSVSNRSYQVQSSTDLQNWQSVWPNAIFGMDGTQTSWAVQKTGPKTFFRVIALKPPAGE